ncbi:MAG: hypothetical protein VX899_19340 [Myxococcota bacterium]|nr:hypothetical protein [Myxococcota bacterium]
MKVDAQMVRNSLSQADPAALREVLEAGGISPKADLSAPELADKLVRALWWRTHTPVGVLAMRDSLGQLVDRTASRLKVELDPDQGDWERLDALSLALLSRCEGVEALEELDDKHVNRLRRSQWVAWTGAAGAGAAAGSGWVSKQLLRLSAPYKPILPLIPKVGPVLVGLRKGAEQVARLSAPVGVGLALFSANQALGAEYDRALALLLGVALVRPRKQGEVIPFDAGHSEE